MVRAPPLTVAHSLPLLKAGSIWSICSSLPLSKCSWHCSWTVRPLKMGRIGCSETSVTNCQFMLYKIPEECGLICTMAEAWSHAWNFQIFVFLSILGDIPSVYWTMRCDNRVLLTQQCVYVLLHHSTVYGFWKSLGQYQVTHSYSI